MVPASSRDLVAVDWPPRDCPRSEQLVVTPTLQRLPLEPVTVEVTTVDLAPPTDPDATLGRWIADTVQIALRAVGPEDVLAGVG